MHNTTVFANAFLPFLRASRAIEAQLLLEHLSESELYPLCEKFVAGALVDTIKGAGQVRGPCRLALVKVREPVLPGEGIEAVDLAGEDVGSVLHCTIHGVEHRTLCSQGQRGPAMRNNVPLP